VRAGQFREDPSIGQCSPIWLPRSANRPADVGGLASLLCGHRPASHADRSTASVMRRRRECCLAGWPDVSHKSDGRPPHVGGTVAERR